MRHTLLIIFTLLTLCRAVAQQTIDDVYQYKIDDERLTAESIYSDTLLFYRAMHRHSDVYGQITDYRFSFVDFSRAEISLSMDSTASLYSSSASSFLAL